MERTIHLEQCSDRVSKKAWKEVRYLIIVLPTDCAVDCTCTGSLLQWLPEFMLDSQGPTSSHDDVSLTAQLQWKCARSVQELVWWILAAQFFSEWHGGEKLMKHSLCFPSSDHASNIVSRLHFGWSFFQTSAARVKHNRFDVNAIFWIWRAGFWTARCAACYRCQLISHQTIMFYIADHIQSVSNAKNFCSRCHETRNISMAIWLQFRDESHKWKGVSSRLSLSQPTNLCSQCRAFPILLSDSARKAHGQGMAVKTPMYVCVCVCVCVCVDVHV